MRIVALSISQPKVICHNDRDLLTGIYNEPVQGRHMVRTTNIDGDGQADLKLHGGPDKAVYAFPSEHYPYYEEMFGPHSFQFGFFGENLTTENMLEKNVRIGDLYRSGDVLFEVSQPRSPCFKFGIKLGSRKAVETCLSSGKTGFYFRVLQEGEIQSGDAIQLEYSNPEAPSVEQTHRLYYFDKQNVADLQRATRCVALTDVWRSEFSSRLKNLEIEDGAQRLSQLN